MSVLLKTSAKRSLLVAVMVTALAAHSVIAADDMLMATAETTEKLFIAPQYTANIVSITEGIQNFPLPRQLSNAIPFDADFTVIFAFGFTADKLNIKVTDNPAFGDRLMAFALAFSQGYGVYPFWGSVYSNDSSGGSFTIDIPVFAPGAMVWLFTGYQRPSVGDNPYSYEITLTFRQ